MKRIFVLLIILASPGAWAVDFEFQNISQGDLEKIVDDFSANFAHTSVSGAGALGDVWGFEVGAVGGITSTDEIDAIIVREGSTADASILPHGALLGRISIPLGLTFEVGAIPEIGGSGFEFSNYSGAVMWTLPLPLPLDLAVKGHITKTDISFTQPVNSVDTKIEFENTITGIDVIASRSFVVLEPYVGVGYIKGDGDMTVSGTDTIFNFTASQTASADDTGIEFFAGVELDFFVKVAVQYANRFGENSYTAKASFGF